MTPSNPEVYLPRIVTSAMIARQRQAGPRFALKIPLAAAALKILASVSTDDGNTWGDPVVIFDHNQRQGTIQVA